MAWFDFGKKDKIIDLTKRLERKETEYKIIGREKSSESAEGSSNLDNDDGRIIDLTNIDQKKKSFAKRISGMIEKIDSLSTKLYHLEQRIEVLERKTKVNNFEKE